MGFEQVFGTFNLDVILKFIKSAIFKMVLIPFTYINALPKAVKIIAAVILFSITLYLAYFTWRNKDEWRHYEM